MPPTVAEFMTQGEALVRAGEPARAAAFFREILGHNPNDADALHMLGVAAFLGNDPGGAVGLITRAIALNPLAGEYHTNLGNALQALHRFPEAEAAYRKALALNPGEPERCHARLADLLVVLGRDDEALAERRRVVELDPGGRDGRYELAALLFRLGRTRRERDFVEESRGLYRGLVRLPDGGEEEAARKSEGLAEIELGRLDLSEGRPEEGLERCTHGLALAEGGDGAGLSLARDMAKPSATTAPPELRTFTDCRVLAGDTEWFVLDDEGQLFVDGMANGNPEVGPFVLLHERGGNSVLRPPFRENKAGAAEVILLGGSRNYYHWLLDYFPRLGTIAARPELAELPLLVNRDLARYQKECLRLAGIPESRLLKVDMPAWIACERVIAPDIGTQDRSFRPEALDWIRRTVGGKGRRQGKKVYLARGKAGFRRVVNEKAVMAFLKQKGFTIADTGKMKVVDQAALIEGADLVVAAHGASLGNLAFAGAGTRVLDLAPGQRMLPHFIASLSQALDFDYRPLRCRPRPTQQQVRAGKEQHFDMEVPLDALEAAVRAAESSLT